MNTGIMSADNELLALESEISMFRSLHSQLMARDSLTTNIALEADQWLGGSEYARLAFDGKSKSEKHQLALEGIASTVWDGIKKLFRKLGDLIKQFIAWFKGEGKKFDAQHLQQVDSYAKQVSVFLEQLTAIVKSPHLKERFEERLNSDLSGKMPASVRAMLDAHSQYSEAISALSGAFDKGDYLDIVEKGVSEVTAWFEKHTARAEQMDATQTASHNDLEAFSKDIQSQAPGTVEEGQEASPLPARGAGQSLELTKSRYEALKQAKTSISTGQYAALPREISALLKIVLEAQGRVKIVAAANAMRTANQTLESMQKHIETVNQKTDRLSEESGDGKHHGAQIALVHAHGAHLRALVSQFQTVLSAHEFLYSLWVETQKESIKIWSQIVTIYDAVVVDEAMSDAERADRAKVEKQAKSALKAYASAI